MNKWNMKEHQDNRERKAKKADKSWAAYVEKNSVTEITPQLWRHWITREKGIFAPSAHELEMVGLCWKDTEKSGWFESLQDSWVAPSQTPEEKFVSLITSMFDELSAESMHNLIEAQFPVLKK